MARDFDSPWKETLDLFLNPILEMFYPDLHAAIDWSRGYESLDTELRTLSAKGEVGDAVADKLFKVYLLDGTEEWILVHIEVQSQRVKKFPKRMFVYHYRILDRYNIEAVSLAILGDESKTWRPSIYEHGRFGCEVQFKYRTVKLLDWQDRMEELEASPNPIAPVVLAHLESLINKKNLRALSDSKWKLIKGLYDRGLSAQQVRQLYKLIDSLLKLPAALQLQLDEKITTLERERKMPYISSIERSGMKKGRKEGRKDILSKALPALLKAKFGDKGRAFAEELNRIEDSAKLMKIFEAVLAGQNLVELRNQL